MTIGNDETLSATYVIVGAGSAGCVLANRLSADPRNRVILLEAGGDDRPFHNPRQFFANMMVHIPGGISIILNDGRLNWKYETEPDPGTKGRRHSWPRGKLLGGSSSINGMFYVRGQDEDFDTWRQLGCDGWSSAEVAPYFRRAEDRSSLNGGDQGIPGPLTVSAAGFANPVMDAVQRGFVSQGVPYNADFNGADQEGVGTFQVTIRNGRRCSSAVAYLHPVMRRENLQVITDVLAKRVLFEGSRAVGVELVRHGRTMSAFASNEIIIAAGAIGSPQLLELSGIGDPAILKSQGLPVIVDRPAVGQNLQDHFMVGMQWRLRAGSPSINRLAHGVRLWREIGRYAFSRHGLPAYPVAHTVAFTRSQPGIGAPDIQYHIVPATMDLDKLYNKGAVVLEDKPGLTMTPCQMRPLSRGSVHISSPDYRVHPRIIPNYISEEMDRFVLLSAIRQARRVADSDEMRPYVEEALGPRVGLQSDDDLIDYARSEGGSGYHPVGTCRMGGDADAVVDPKLRVRGVRGLRIVDASIMPRLTSGNTNAPTIMIGEKASDLILEGA